MPTEADIQEFQSLFLRRFGVKLGRDDAYAKLCLLVRQMELIYQPISKLQLKKLTDEGNEDEPKKKISK